MASDINKVILLGRLTRDAELSYTQSGYSLLKFSIAVNRNRKQDDRWIEEASFFDVTVFGRQGEAIANYMTKGKQVGVEGQLRQDRWESQDGTRRSKIVIDANYVQLLGSRGGDTGGSWTSGLDSAPQSDSQPGIQKGPPPTSFEDDIPF
ncbi:Single-stranded DNA-binding protein [Olavius algarvensis spirochete endosymbiont]|uniref:single-stranded DNA-binding protein n=1 Tax=Olavius algarvensis spirochete endosymbiont TaxID=260710 RepID=UPI00052C5095|nr:single-stranded DNA-binding protein [Olavius algarvensis spirochete endosymbiont]KGM42668.1 single-stranded DNA-binding protein [Alkalispirochaeta odontotermitis]VDB00386.1 Single-stranded DNA-binding protein [Olavius algarvensis spirochete endosymbiont]